LTVSPGAAAARLWERRLPAVEVWATHHGLPHVVGMRRGRGGVFGGVGIPATRALEIKGRLCPGGRALPLSRVCRTTRHLDCAKTTFARSSRDGRVGMGGTAASA